MKKSKYNNKLINCWFVFLIISLVWLFISAKFIDSTLRYDLLYSDIYDSFMDHFNSMVVVKDRKPYSTYSITYPPLAALFYYFFYNLAANDAVIQISNAYPDVSVREIRNVSSAITPFVIFISICIIFISYLIFTKIDTNNKNRFKLIICTLISSGMIYCIDRGNNVILVFVLLLFYVLNYNSENKFLSELAVICLALATGLKLYPIVFGLLLIKDNKIAQGFRTIGYIILSFIIPSFFFEGFEGLKILFNNLFKVSGPVTDVRFINFASIIVKLETVFNIDISDMFYSIFTVIFIGVGLLSSFTFEKSYKSILFASLAVIGYAGISCDYVLLFMILPFLIMINQKRLSKSDVIYAILIVFLNLPIVIPSPAVIANAGTTLISVLHAIVLIILMVMIVFDGIISIIDYVKQKKWKKYFVRFSKTKA